MRTVTFHHPTDPTQFGPEQLRPRVLLGMVMTTLARWLAEHLVPYSRLMYEHRTAFVFSTVHLTYAEPSVRFADADSLPITGAVAVSESATYLRVTAEITSLRYGHPDEVRPVGSLHAALRVVTVAETEALSAEPGALPGPLFRAFRPDEIYAPDRAAIARAAALPEGTELFRAPGHEVTLCRSHCELADQWSFSEVVEVATTARERLFTDPAVPAPVRRAGAAHPLRAVGAVFHRAMYLFDTCRITTRLLTPATGPGTTAFVHTFTDPVRPGPPCVTVWELGPAATGE